MIWKSGATALTVARRVCDLTNNKLKKLPAALGRLSMLTSLTLDSNHLKALPAELCNLVRLEILSCGHNGLLSLPENIGALTKLKKLLLAGAPLSRSARSPKHLRLAASP